MNTATFRFYAELGDFLPPEKRGCSFVHGFNGEPRVKDTIESLGVPHVEVDVILANGRSVDFDYRLRAGDRIAVYPAFESIDISPLVRLRAKPLRRTAFVADVHLRRLARYLRLLGFDTLHSNAYSDVAIVAIAETEKRIILTRDRALLKRGAVTHGYWVRSTDPITQAREVLGRFDLRGQVNAFARCPACNGAIVPVPKDDVLDRIPPKTALWQEDYFLCKECGKLYWRGTHFPRLKAIIDRIIKG